MSEMIFTAKEVESMMQECAFKSVAKVLDMIRAEIEQINPLDYPHDERTPERMIGKVLEIIDRYRT